MSRTSQKRAAERPKMPTNETSISYEESVQGSDEPRMMKVSVTVNRGLLELVDHYVIAHPRLSRSEVFDFALQMWAKDTQAKSDRVCYGDRSRSDEKDDWTAIQTESAKHIW
jgi:metal-responsive CopG/Arc/MetJ family transcriptional regulator